jgi:putative nucleotidyltransferase with HDIG domain
MAADEILKHIDQVPLLPTNIRRIMAIVDDPRADMAMLAKVVEEDPTLAMQALKLCNSAYYSLPVEVASISHAVRFLGTETVGGLAMASYFQGIMQLGKRKANPWLRDAGRHMLSTARIAEKLARMAEGGMPPPTAFTAGLLHDVGKLVFSRLDPELAEKVHELVGGEGLALIDAEGEILGMDHAEVGARLCEKWDMPEIITEAVRDHHVPLSGKFISTQYVYIANSLYYAIVQDDDLEVLARDRDVETVLAEAGLTFAQLQHALLNFKETKLI